MSERSTPPRLTPVTSSLPDTVLKRGYGNGSPAAIIDTEGHRLWAAANRHLEDALELFDALAVASRAPMDSDAYSYASGTQDVLDVSKRDLRLALRGELSPAAIWRENNRDVRSG